MNRVKGHHVRAQRIKHLGRITAALVMLPEEEEDYTAMLVRNEVGRWVIIPGEPVDAIQEDR